MRESTACFMKLQSLVKMATAIDKIAFLQSLYPRWRFLGPRGARAAPVYERA